jgi:hypothetical protein
MRLMHALDYRTIGRMLRKSRERLAHPGRLNLVCGSRVCYER